jgi:hypothetical protein
VFDGRTAGLGRVVGCVVTIGGIVDICCG